MEIGYKVVSVTKHGHLMSCTALGCPRRYVSGKETRPAKGDGPLTVFETCQQAYKFLKTLRSNSPRWSIFRYQDRFTGVFEIWRVQYEPSDWHKIWRVSRIRRRCHIELLAVSRMPSGTVLADLVLPIECIAHIHRSF